MSNVIVLLVLLTAASPAIADQSSASKPHPNLRFGALRTSQDPYKKLFQAPALQQPPVKAQMSAAKRRVVCGMTVIPANPSADPKMAIPRKSDGIDYAIRVIDPPNCEIPN